jgi:hypothetical protein
MARLPRPRHFGNPEISEHVGEKEPREPKPRGCPSFFYRGASHRLLLCVAERTPTVKKKVYISPNKVNTALCRRMSSA